MISGYHRGVNAIFAILGLLRRGMLAIYRRFGITHCSYQAGQAGTDFWDNISVTSLSFKQSKKIAWHLQLWPMCCAETSVDNYQSTPHNIPAGRKFRMCKSCFPTTKRTLQTALYKQSVNAVGLYEKQKIYICLENCVTRINTLRGRMQSFLKVRASCI